MVKLFPEVLCVTDPPEVPLAVMEAIAVAEPPKELPAITTTLAPQTAVSLVANVSVGDTSQAQFVLNELLVVVHPVAVFLTVKV